jgi:hypothetical protein
MHISVVRGFAGASSSDFSDFGASLFFVSLVSFFLTG